MPRNIERDIYLTIGLPRASETYRKLVADARESDVSLSKLIVLRVTDWYQMNLRQVVLVTDENRTDTDFSLVTPKAHADSVTAREEHENQTQRNAALALDAWLS